MALFEPAPVGLYSVECGGVTVAHGEALPLERSTIEVELERPIQVDVTCVDGKKRAIADARVLAGGGGGGPFTEVGRTDSLGRCRVAEVHADAQWYAYSPELACRDAVALPKGSGAQATVKLVLDRASGSVSVRVVDERRRAIPGATVLLNFGSSRGWLFSWRPARVTKSNAEGLATVEGLPERANVKLSIRARGFAPLEDVDDNDFERDETGAVCIEMSAGANVSGIAMLEGRPAKHAWVIAGGIFDGFLDVALTDSVGRYRLGSLPQGEVSLVALIAWKDGARLSMKDDVDTGDVFKAEVELTLDSGKDHVWNPVLERE